MTKQPFTLSGISAVQQQLYALSDPALKSEITSLQTNFPAWITSHFILQQPQVDFLNSIPQEMIKAVVPDIGISLQQKIEIQVKLPTGPIPPLGSKMMDKERSILYHYDEQLGMQYSGSLIIKFSYRS